MVQGFLNGFPKRSGRLCVLLFHFEKKRVVLFGLICIYSLRFAFHHPRDYSQDLDALLISKPSRFSCDMLSIYQDHVSKPIMKSVTGDSAATAADVDEAEDFFMVYQKRLKNQKLCSILPKKSKHQISIGVIQPYYNPGKENLKQAEYAVVCTNLSHDFKETVSFNLRRNKTDSNRHVQKAGSWTFCAVL